MAKGPRELGICGRNVQLGLVSLVIISCGRSNLPSEGDGQTTIVHADGSRADADLGYAGCYRDPYLPDNYLPPCDQPKAVPNCRDGWCTIEPGCFFMGSPWCEWGRAKYSNDPIQVTLTHRFRIQQFEVTQGQWTAQGLHNPSTTGINGNGDCIASDCPVGHINWVEVVAYANLLSRQDGLPECYSLEGVQGELGKGLLCDFVRSPYVLVYDCPGYRLPTGAEWEYAARAGTKTSTYNGDVIYRGYGFYICYEEPVLSPIAWYCANAGPNTHPVGQKLPNDWGLYDMIGNAMELTGSVSAPYAGGVYVDWGAQLVVSPSSIIEHGGYIMQTRGGGFNQWPHMVNVNNQAGAPTRGVGTGGGFRLVQTLK